MKNTLSITLLAAILGSALTIGVFWIADKQFADQSLKIEHVNATSPLSTSNISTPHEIALLDFTEVADAVMPAVVHIKSTVLSNPSQSFSFPEGRNPFEDFFGEEFFRRFPQAPNQRTPRNQSPQARVETGSGVLITADGYIATNNHVIDQAEDIEVTLHDNRTYKAKVIGTDPSTDLALLQIKEKDLPFLPFGNSDEVKVGQWVLAVGNPFNLNSTVTAGIVSAKGRNINILSNQSAIESFIQTDAAINPGNSGGALVNMTGGLIGVNTAIASPTGSYAGYGFAVPVNMVEKVVSDLRKFGIVQRGFLGILIRDVDGNLAKEKDLSITEGVYVDSLLENSAAAKAGIKPGDVIQSVNGNTVHKAPELQEIVGCQRPGDKVNLTINRSGKEKTIIVTLNNRDGNTELVEKEHKEMLAILGADLQTIDKKTAAKLEINGGVKVNKLYAGKLRKQTQMKEGFIITKADHQTIENVDKLIKHLEDKGEGGVLFEGVYEDLPGEYFYAFGL